MLKFMRLSLFFITFYMATIGSYYWSDPNLIVVLWYNGSQLAILLNGIEVSRAKVITK